MTPTPVKEQLSFYDALREVTAGKKITRLSWVEPDYGYLKDGFLTLYRAAVSTDFIWKVSDGDLEGLDWVIVEDLN